MSFYNDFVAKLDDALDQDNVITRYLDKLEKKLNVKKRYIALGNFLIVHEH